MDYSVEGLCNQLARSRLLPPDTVRALRLRWRAEAGAAADDGEKFGKWLVAGRYISDFQLGLLTRGFGDMLFFGDYKLVDRIGQGRMAGIYKAVHPTGQVVALKVLPPSKAANPQTLARFQRESRLALRLKHPNVVRTFQRGQTRAGLHYLVMEHLDGEDLEDVLKRRKRLPIPEAAHVLAQAFQGLQHLHEEGLIHRDLKPANLMLVPARPDTTLHSTVKILDIGLGKALFDLDEGLEGAPDNPDLTTEGSLLGTPNYMAPEQARSAHKADIRADIYSLGCVLYETLTGQPPFPDSSFLRQMVRHATEAPQPLKAHLPAAPEELQAVLDSLLAKDPAQRYSTPAQAARALKTFITAEAEAPRPLEAEPQMRSYLTWLAKRPPEQDEEPTLLPTAAPMPAAPPKAAPPAAPVAAVAAVAVAAAPVAVPQLAVHVAQVAPANAANRPQTPVPVAVPLPPAAAPRPDFKARLQELGLTPRDLLAAGAGAGGVLLVELFLWLLIRLFR
jgi:serine/threonine protein kinase